MESWPFGRGWELEKFTLEMTSPRFAPMIGYPDAWSRVDEGRDRRHADSRRRAVVGFARENARRAQGRDRPAQPMMTTFIREDRVNPFGPTGRRRLHARRSRRRRTRRWPRRRADRGAEDCQAILHDAGVGAVLKPSRGEHGTIFVQTRDARRERGADRRRRRGALQQPHSTSCKTAYRSRYAFRQSQGRYFTAATRAATTSSPSCRVRTRLSKTRSS